MRRVTLSSVVLQSSMLDFVFVRRNINRLMLRALLHEVPWSPPFCGHIAARCPDTRGIGLWLSWIGHSKVENVRLQAASFDGSEGPNT